MLDVKTDMLEASFEALEQEGEDIATLKEEVAQMRRRLDEGAVAAARPADFGRGQVSVSSCRRAIQRPCSSRATSNRPVIPSTG